MIRGIVTNHQEAQIRLIVVGTRGRRRSIEGVLDTGFNGFLTLPGSLAAKLGLVWRRRGKAELADGGETTFSVYEATVLWDDRRRRIEVDEAETIPLIGMKMLVGFELRMKVIAGGPVTITRLRS